MPAGGPGDEPLLDILRWHRPVFAAAVDALAAEIAELGGREWLEREFVSTTVVNGLIAGRTADGWAALERRLRTKRDELYHQGSRSGWDMRWMDERLRIVRDEVAATWANPEHRPRIR